MKKFSKTFAVLLLAVLTVFSPLSVSAAEDDSSSLINTDVNSGYESSLTLDDLKGGTLAISTSNEIYIDDIEAVTGDISVTSYSAYADSFIAVTTGKADFSMVFRYVFTPILESYPGMRFVPTGKAIPVGAAFSDKSGNLKDEFNDFIAQSKENGLMDELEEKWMVNYGTNDDYVDFDSLTGGNGTVEYAAAYTNAPMNYISNGHPAGFEAALVYEFCKAYGYRVNSTDTAYESVLMGISSGKYDISTGDYGITDDRSEEMNFSDPYLYDELVLCVYGNDEESEGFLAKIKDSFYRDFIEDSRYKTILSGLLITVEITAASVAAGGLIGFLLYLVFRKNRFALRVIEKINDCFESLPILVVLLIFFFAIFGSSKISGVTVSVIVFGLAFVFSTAHLLIHSVDGIDKGQTEGAMALGYTDRDILFKVLLPQAAKSFLPAFRSSVIACLKGTAIVGYVAVTDLTKAGDIIRSRTFDAFIPLVTIALIYFAVAKLIIFLIERINVDPKKRKNSRYLREVKK